MAKILVLNGPNLNLLGTREPQYYGTTTLDEIRGHMRKLAQDAKCDLDWLQSNAEHELINAIHQAAGNRTDFIIINPAAFTHTSVAIRDALNAVGIPFIEVHISNIHAREEFRQHSFLADLAVGQICGLGAKGYELALLAALDQLSDDDH